MRHKCNTKNRFPIQSAEMTEDFTRGIIFSQSVEAKRDSGT